jgi:hypothetical protein
MYILRLDYKNGKRSEYVWANGPDGGLGQAKANLEVGKICLEKGGIGIIMDEAGREAVIRGAELISVELGDPAIEAQVGYLLQGELQAVHAKYGPPPAQEQRDQQQQWPPAPDDSGYQPAIGGGPRFAA